MDTLKLIFSLVVFALISPFMNAQWTEVEWAETDGISNLNFVDDLTGYAKMHQLQGFLSSFEKTEDGGETWTDFPIPVNVTDVQDMDFLANGSGALVSRTYIDGGTETKIFKTLDNGETWDDITPMAAPNGYGLSQIQMLDNETIFFVIDDYFYRTTNGGSDWNSALFTQATISVDFFDQDHGVVGTWDGTFLYGGGMMSTSDGGQTWNETLLEDLSNSVIGVVKQFSATSAYAAPVKWGAGGHSHFYKTTDNGQNWTMIEVPETDDDAKLLEFDFRDGDVGVVILNSNDQTYLYKTSNGAETWELQNQMDLLYISDLQLTPASGYASAELGQLFRMDASSSIQEQQGIDLTLYPNPCAAGEQIHWNSNVRFDQLQIFDARGSLIHEQIIDSNQVLVPVLSKGVYVLALHGSSVSKNVRIVVE